MVAPPATSSVVVEMPLPPLEGCMMIVWPGGTAGAVNALKMSVKKLPDEDEDAGVLAVPAAPGAAGIFPAWMALTHATISPVVA